MRTTATFQYFRFDEPLLQSAELIRHDVAHSDARHGSSGQRQRRTSARTISAQQASGQSIWAWCRAHDCREHALYWSRARLALSTKSGVKRRRRGPALAGFAEVVFDRSMPAEAITLRLRGRRERVLPASMQVESLAKLVHAIEASV